MYLRRFIVYLTWVLGMYPSAVSGQEAEPLPSIQPSSVTTYDIDQGLSISCLREVFVDAKGRLWLNPCRYQDIYKGLGFYQFDGEKSHQVSPVTNNPSNQNLNWFLHGITPDGNLFGSDLTRRFVFVFDPESQQGQPFEFSEEERVMRVISDNTTNSIYAWTRTAKGHSIYRLSGADKVLLGEIPASDQHLPGKDFLPPAVVADGRLWFFDYLHGFFGFDLVSSTFDTYSWSALWPGLLPDAGHISMVANGKGQLLFFLQIQQGFFQFDIATASLAPELGLNQFMSTLSFHEFDGIEMLSDAQGNVLLLIDYINAASLTNSAGYAQSLVLLDTAGELFDLQPVAQAVATAGRYSTANANFAFSNDFREKINFVSNGGLAVVELPANLPIRTQILSKGCRAMAELNSETILALTDIGHIELVPISITNPSVVLEEWGHCPQPYKLPAFAQLIKPAPNELWFPTREGDLVRTNPSTNDCKAYNVGQSFDKFGLLSDNEAVLVGLDNVVYRFDMSTSSLHPFLLNGQPLNLGGSANEVHIAANGVAWIATLNGLWEIDFNLDKIRRWGKADGLADDRIFCIHEMENGTLWLGTFSAGIIVFDPQKGSMQVIGQESGLSNNTVVGILSDQQGDLWVSTFNRINVLTPNGEVLLKLNEEDGLNHQEFNRFSYLKLSNGDLAFGGVDGITILAPEGIKKALAPKDDLQIYLSSLSYFDKQQGEDVVFRDQLSSLATITLPPTHRYLYLDFALSSYSSPEKCNFSFRLIRRNGKDEERRGKWTSIGYNSELSLNDLSPGSYDIQVRGTDHKGRVTEHPITIPIHVKEFFYKTWWFYALCSLFLCSLVMIWIKRLQTEKIRLEAEVKKRTKQIQEDKALIEKQAEELQKLDEMKSRFFTNISHEFRTPLTIISGMVTQIRQHPEQWMEKGMELIHRNTKQLLNLINQILDLRKLESGAIKPNLIQGDIIPYLRYLSDSFMPLAELRGIRVHFLSTGSELVMDYDPDKMLHILSNLLSNAIKYTPDGGDIYVQIDQLNEVGQEWLHVRIRDTGQGIGPEALPYIFDRFYQVEDLASQKPQGSGIGLALTQEMVKLMKGTIEVDSAPGAGTTFFLKFPVNREAQLQEGFSKSLGKESMQTPLAGVPEKTQAALKVVEQSNDPGTMEEGSMEDNGLPTVLLVEDNADLRLYVTSFLENRYRVMTANDGGEGIRVATEKVPDLIVSDVMMPVKDGFELCNTLKNDERTSHIPIILLTAKADFDSKMSGLRKGADAYLTKPFEQEELLVRLEQLFSLRKKLQERYQNAALTPPSSPAPQAVYELEDAFIQKLRQLVLDNIAEEDFGIAHLCRGLQVSRTQLHNKIKALTGQSTSEFVRMVRLYKARELLQTTDLNVSEVGYEVGISSPAYFSRIYSEAFGEPPGNARNG